MTYKTGRERSNVNVMVAPKPLGTPHSCQCACSHSSIQADVPFGRKHHLQRGTVLTAPQSQRLIRFIYTWPIFPIKTQDELQNRKKTVQSRSIKHLKGLELQNWKTVQTKKNGQRNDHPSWGTFILTIDHTILRKSMGLT